MTGSTSTRTIQYVQFDTIQGAPFSYYPRQNVPWAHICCGTNATEYVRCHFFKKLRLVYLFDSVEDWIVYGGGRTKEKQEAFIL
jgi:hypothetical protein